MLAMPKVGAQAVRPAAPVADRSSPQTALVRSVRVVRQNDGPAVEILSNRPLVPTIQKLDGPPRLVIDLPDATLATSKKRLDFRSDEINSVRVDQFQNQPPITRVVIDLSHPIGYSWDAAGNRLMVRLHSEAQPAAPPTVPSFSATPQPAVVPVVPGASSGAVMLAGNRVAAGSSVTAGSDTALLHLARGGEVRVCPQTTVSVTPSANGHDLMLGMSTGALEAHYRLEASADSILTPDFRILLAGPGEFHYAIRVDPKGNTCIRALPGNTASLIVSELMGDGTYQVKPSDQILFHGGRLAAIDTSVGDACGCPAPPVPVMRAAAPLPDPIPEAKLPSNLRLAQPGEQFNPVPPPVSASDLPAGGPSPQQVTLAATGPETAPLPPIKPEDVHVQVDAPFVFRASDPPPVKPAPDPRQLPVGPAPSAAWMTPSVAPPPSPLSSGPENTELASGAAGHHGFFGKVKGFFAALFR
jgi:hypothetical protein